MAFAPPVGALLRAISGLKDIQHARLLHKACCWHTRISILRFLRTTTRRATTHWFGDLLRPRTFPLLPTQYSNASQNTHPTILPTQYSRECVAKRERHTAGAPAETMSHGGTAKEVTLCFFSPHPLLCYLFPAHPRALPYPMGTSSDPASLPYYLAAFCITNYSKTTLAKRPIPQSGVSGSGYVMRGRKGG